MQNSQIKASLIGTPLDLGAKNLGVDIGPEAFRHAGIIDKLASAGIEAKDEGNIECTDRSTLDPGSPHLKYLPEIVRVNGLLADKVELAIKSERKPIVLGGDHSVNLGALTGASNAVGGEIGMVYFDAHGDINTHETTLSGNIHGMHLASLMGFGAPELAHLKGEHTKLNKENLLHIGGSDFDQGELDLIEQENIATFTLFDLLTKNLGALLPMIDDLAARVPNIWVSLDLDSIDRLYAPGAGMPNEKGLTYREISAIAEYVGKKCNVIGLDVVEYNPLQDIDHKTAELGIELIATFLNKKYSWYSNYLQNNKL
jgi:arginase